MRISNVLAFAALASAAPITHHPSNTTATSTIHEHLNAPAVPLSAKFGWLIRRSPNETGPSTVKCTGEPHVSSKFGWLIKKSPSSPCVLEVVDVEVESSVSDKCSRLAAEAEQTNTFAA